MERNGELEAREGPFYDALTAPGLFLLGQTRAGQGWYRSFPDMNALLAFLRAHQSLACIPTFTSAGGQSLVHYFPGGVDASKIDQACELAVSQDSSLTLAALDDTLKFFASEKLLNHPRHRSTCWKDADKFIPQKTAEKNIQAMLVIVLQTHFKDGIVCEEITVPTGRTDVVLEQTTPSSRTKILIELKAARSFSSMGRTYKEASIQRWCESGLKQANLNGKDLGADHSLLCTYDLRKAPNEDLRTHITACGKAVDVKVGWYRVFTSSAALRDKLSA